MKLTYGSDTSSLRCSDRYESAVGLMVNMRFDTSNPDEDTKAKEKSLQVRLA